MWKCWVESGKTPDSPKDQPKTPRIRPIIDATGARGKQGVARGISP